MQELEAGKGRKIYSHTGDGPYGQKTARTALLTIGPIGHDAEEVARQLDITHYDMRFLKPIDEDILRCVAEQCDVVVTVEDGVRNGGLGSAVTEWMDDHHHPVHVERIGLPDSFVEHGTVAELRRIAGLDKDAITKTCLREAGIDEA